MTVLPPIHTLKQNPQLLIQTVLPSVVAVKLYQMLQVALYPPKEVLSKVCGQGCGNKAGLADWAGQPNLSLSKALPSPGFLVLPTQTFRGYAHLASAHSHEKPPALPTLD